MLDSNYVLRNILVRYRSATKSSTRCYSGVCACLLQSSAAVRLSIIVPDSGTGSSSSLPPPLPACHCCPPPPTSSRRPRRLRPIRLLSRDGFSPLPAAGSGGGRRCWQYHCTLFSRSFCCHRWRSRWLGFGLPVRRVALFFRPAAPTLGSGCPSPAGSSCWWD